MPANVNVNEDILKKIYHINSGVCSGHSYLVPATIGALARIGVANQREEERKFFPSLYVFLSVRELCHVFDGEIGGQEDQAEVTTRST